MVIFILIEDNRVQIRLNIASYMDSHHVHAERVFTDEHVPATS